MEIAEPFCDRVELLAASLYLWEFHLEISKALGFVFWGRFSSVALLPLSDGANETFLESRTSLLVAMFVLFSFMLELEM